VLEKKMAYLANEKSHTNKLTSMFLGNILPKISFSRKPVSMKNA